MPSMPSVSVTRRGAKNSTTPSPMLNQPSARASWSAGRFRLGPPSMIFGSPLVRTMLEK